MKQNAQQNQLTLLCIELFIRKQLQKKQSPVQYHYSHSSSLPWLTQLIRRADQHIMQPFALISLMLLSSMRAATSTLSGTSLESLVAGLGYSLGTVQQTLLTYSILQLNKSWESQLLLLNRISRKSSTQLFKFKKNHIWKKVGKNLVSVTM